MQRFGRPLLLVAALVVATELAVRMAGVVDFPLYVVDPAVGYQFRANQEGRFLNRNTWAVNERGMPTARRWDPARQENLLLIGNSIIAGGNPYDQSERIGFLIERSLADRYAVWPVAVGGWSTANATAYLQKYADVTDAADFFVWTHLSGGLRVPGQWLGDGVFPRRRPLWATWYALERYVWTRFVASPAPPA